MILDSKIIIITGGSSGIGFSIAKKLVSEGANVILLAKNKDKLISAIDKLESIRGKHHYFNIDVSVYEQVEDLKKKLIEKSIKIDGLINCAGVYGPIGKTINLKIEDIIKTLNVNLIGTINTCSLLYDTFNKKSTKKIINLSGGGAASPFPNYSAYSMSKVSIVRFTENLSLELKDYNFNINCIAPGFVITDLHQETINAGSELVGNEFYNSTLKQIKDGGISPDYAANLALFLISDESNGITGKFISAPWDPWNTKEFQELLKKDKDFATLRRIDNKYFFKKE